MKRREVSVRRKVVFLLAVVLTFGHFPMGTFAGPLALEITRNTLQFHLPHSYFDHFANQGHALSWHEMSSGVLHRLEGIFTLGRRLKSMASDYAEYGEDSEEDEEEGGGEEEEETETIDTVSRAQPRKSKYESVAETSAVKESNAANSRSTKLAGDKGSSKMAQTHPVVDYARGGDQDTVTDESGKHENTTRLSEMVFKLIKSQGITSVADIPCRNTISWFPNLLHRLDYDIPGFKYYCVDSDKISQDDIRPLFSDAGSPEFLHVRPSESNSLPHVDMVFSWNGPQQWGIGLTWAFFSGIREVRPGLVVVTNNPGVTNVNGGPGVINLRKQPFHVRQGGLELTMV